MQQHVTAEMVAPAAIRLCVSVCVRAAGLTTYTAPLKHQLDFALLPLDILHIYRRICICPFR